MESLFWKHHYFLAGHCIVRGQLNGQCADRIQNSTLCWMDRTWEAILEFRHSHCFGFHRKTIRRFLIEWKRSGGGMSGFRQQAYPPATIVRSRSVLCLTSTLGDESKQTPESPRTVVVHQPDWDHQPPAKTLRRVARQCLRVNHTIAHVSFLLIAKRKRNKWHWLACRIAIAGNNRKQRRSFNKSLLTTIGLTCRTVDF